MFTVVVAAVAVALMATFLPTLPPVIALGRYQTPPRGQQKTGEHAALNESIQCFQGTLRKILR